jgi:hypothetical protein
VDGQAASCATRQKWEGGSILARPELVAQEFGPLLLEQTLAAQTPDIPMPKGLRPCCAFGANLEVELGPVPVPMVSLTNVIGVDDLGPHQYDHGVITFEQSRPGGDVLTSERNGLVYTCHGGFIDTAHFRDWADWTLYLSGAIARTLTSGTTITLSDEGGQRSIVTAAVDPQRVAQYGALPLAVPLAQWLAFQLSVWHEIATWYGWSSTPFSEQASAFSPEDLYSNLLGTKAAAVLIYQGYVSSEATYNESMNAGLPVLLEHLGAVPGETGRAAMRSVDGVWWDSRARLPEKRLVRQRYMDDGPRMSPWLVPRGWRADQSDPAVVAACSGHDQPLILSNPDEFAGVPFRTLATVEITVSNTLAAAMPLPNPPSRRITQDDFVAIIAHIRAENEREFGVGASRPEPQECTIAR